MIIKKTGAVILFLFIVLMSKAQELSIRKGMVIRKSTRIKNSTYLMKGSDSLDHGIILIEGDNITVDFNGALLKGNAAGETPEAYRGIAILVKKGRNITIKNLRARGYKIALIARDIEGLKIEHCDFSYNYRSHLNSDQEKEDISDWMSYHRNEQDEWLRYGAAIYLRGCRGARVNHCTVTGGQNALMMVDCTGGMIWNNDFSFNSGIGLGFYRCSGNKVLYNRINFNVRGYSHGVYNRGQDSAGILVYEQSQDNLFYKNSVTHGGDGFFLWAGQTTMESGKGGCNDNQIIGNDFSYAPTNGIEVTFSRNLIRGNRIFECDHGIWGGYSYATIIAGNQFRDNRIGIAIEHGQHNQIVNNLFSGDGEAIRLWSAPRQPDWGYARNHDTRSVDYLIGLNSFNRNRIVYHLWNSDSLNISGNTYSHCSEVFRVDSAVTHLDSFYIEVPESPLPDLEIKNPQDPFRGNGRLSGRKNIMITEWGPYDFRYPIIWNSNPGDTARLMRFDLLGPKGRWKIVSVRGLEGLSSMSDTFPTHITGRRTGTEGADIEVTAEYTGPAFTDQFGNRQKATRPYRFIYKKFFQPIPFIVKWYDYDSLSNPLRLDTPAHVAPQIPFKTDTVPSIDYAWWGGIREGGRQHDRFLTIAEGRFMAGAGNYELSATWDDALRIYVNDSLVLDEWKSLPPGYDGAPNRRVRLKMVGEQHIRVEHVETGGFSTLRLRFNKLD